MPFAFLTFMHTVRLAKTSQAEMNIWDLTLEEIDNAIVENKVKFTLFYHHRHHDKHFIDSMSALLSVLLLLNHPLFLCPHPHIHLSSLTLG